MVLYQLKPQVCYCIIAVCLHAAGRNLVWEARLCIVQALQWEFVFINDERVVMDDFGQEPKHNTVKAIYNCHNLSQALKMFSHHLNTQLHFTKSSIEKLVAQ